MSISWVFFDVGDVLFNEDAPHALFLHSLLASMRDAGIQVTWDEFHARIIECVRAAPNTAITDAVQTYVRPPSDWAAIYHAGRGVYEAIRKPRPYGVLLDNMLGVLEQVSKKLKIGIIANQHPEVLQGLTSYGVDALAKVRVIDQVVGVSKPDPAIFRIAFERAGCRPEEAMMVGDRPDNDIAPAKALGLRTLRFRRGMLYAHYEPRSDAERADVEVTDIATLADEILKLAR